MTIYLVLYNTIAGYGIEIFLKGAYSSLEKAEEECKKLHDGWIREVKMDHDYDVCPFEYGEHYAEAITFNTPIKMLGLNDDMPETNNMLYIGGYEE